MINNNSPDQPANAISQDSPRLNARPSTETIPGPSPLLTTKLYVPPLRPSLVERTRLLEQLQNGLRLGCKLTLICAPAGFGKTTLVSEWLYSQQEAQPDPAAPVHIAWLSLDDEDNDPIRFLTYLVAALQQLDSAVGEGLLQSRQPLPPNVLVTLLINDLAAIAHPFALVLDDYHLIQNDSIHEIIELLLEHQPPHMHLVLASREDPPLPLSRLRVRGQMVEIRQEDLRFTPQEARAFLNRSMGLSLPSNAVTALANRTEGWVAGLQLAALSLQGRTTEHAESFIQAFSGSHRYVIDYLVEEVIQQQSKETRHFLRQTAILDRLSAPLCDAVTEQNKSKTILETLEHANLFLIPLDDRREWYRYHHLFADFLKTEPDSQQQAALHHRAACWFESNGHLTEAVKHTLAAQNIPQAGQLIKQAADELLHNGELMTLLGWFQALPDDVVQADAELSTYKGWILWLTGQSEAAETYIASAQASLPKNASRLSRGKLKSLQACLAVARSSKGIQVAQDALELLDDTGDSSFFKGITLLILSEAQNVYGHTADAIQSLQELFRIAQQHNDRFMMVGAQVNLAQQLNWLGQRSNAVNLSQQAIERCLDANGQPLPLAGLGYFSLAEMEYWANDLTSAQQHLEIGMALSKQLGLLGSQVTSKLTQAQIFQATGKTEEALAATRDVYQLVVENNFDTYLEVTTALVADLQLKSGDTDAAKRWAETMDFPQPDTLPPFKEYEYILYANYLIQTDQATLAEKVLILINQSASQAGRNLMRLLIALLQTEAYLALDRRQDALACLEQAILLAHPEDYLRPFLNRGPSVAKLLPQLRHVAPDFVDALLDAFSNGPSDAEASPEEAEPFAADSLIEPLSEREIEVLQLVAAGQSNRDIAENLFVTLGTVKKHLNNIYGKLGVKSRTQAIASAREFELIE